MILSKKPLNLAEVKILASGIEDKKPIIPYLKAFSKLSKYKATITEIEETINYAKYALTRITEPIELAQKLIDLEAQIIKFGSDRLLMVIENILKRATIQRSDVFEAVKAIRT